MDAKFILFLICVSNISRANGKILKPTIESDENLFDILFEHGRIVNSTVAKAVTKFSCMVEFEDAELLVYGTKAWQFPEQDINLTLTYPSAYYMDDDDYVITGFKVLLFVDTAETTGYINSGGIFEEHLSLSFVSPQVNMLFYQFWLYGTPKSSPSYTSLTVNNLC